MSCSVLVKTYIDCLFKPDYAGEIVEIAKAIYASKDKIKWDKLLDYAKKKWFSASYQTFGIYPRNSWNRTKICWHITENENFIIVVLDTELPQTGKRLSRWSIQQNLETETIKSAIYTWSDQRKYNKKHEKRGSATSKLKRTMCFQGFWKALPDTELWQKFLSSKAARFLRNSIFGLAGTFRQNVTFWEQTLAEKPENMTW